jgi:hypothetical protein
MDPQVDEIITDNRSGSDSNVTGIAYAKTFYNKCRFSVLPQKLGDFTSDLASLCEEDIHAEEIQFAQSDDDSDPTLADFAELGHPLAEVVGGKRTLPVMIRMKLPFILNINQRREPELFDNDFLKRTIFCIQRLLDNLLRMGVNSSEYIAIVEQSRLWTEGDITYQNIRFTFPYCQVDRVYQQKVLLPKITESLRQNKIMSYLEVQPTCDWPGIIQPIGDVIPMYRGKDSIKSAPMTISHVYSVVFDPNDSQDYVVDLEDVMQPSHYSYIYSKVVDPAFLVRKPRQSPDCSGDEEKERSDDEDEEMIEMKYWLPMFLSIHFWSGENSPKEEEHEEKKEDLTQYDDDVTSDDPVIMLKYLLPLLSVDRYDVEPFWREVGQILFNIYKGNDHGLKNFIQFSANSEADKRGYKDCADYYNALSRDHMSIKTIAWFARKDSPLAYQRWHDAWTKNCLYDALDLIDDTVARIIYRLFWLEHIYVEGGKWMTFSENMVVSQGEAMDLRRDITDKMVPIYRKLRSVYAENPEGQNGLNRKQAEVYVKQISDIIVKLGKQGSKMTFIKAAQPFFEVKGFNRIKDSNPAKTGWVNCVIVCSGDHAYCTEGKLEDYLTKTTSNFFRNDYNWETPIVKKVTAWFHQIFPDRDLFHYVMKDIASYFYGRNAEKLLRAWCGNGDNSKTMMAQCIQKMLGDYCIDFPNSFLTGKPMGTSGPNPELAQAGGAHVGFVPETEEDEKIREGTAKRATGGDRQFARSCNENGGPMQMGAKVILMCNKIPDFTCISKALMNRFVYLPFLSTWSSNAPESYDEQERTRTFKKDPFFENQLYEMSQGLAWVAVQYYSYYKSEGLKPPPIVTQYTNQHWEDNDPVKCFLTECVRPAFIDANQTIVDNSQSLNKNQLYGPYKGWYARNYPQTTIVSCNKFVESVSIHLGQQGAGKRWFGVIVDSTGGSAAANQQQPQQAPSSNGGMQPMTIGFQSSGQPQGTAQDLALMGC